LGSGGILACTGRTVFCYIMFASALYFLCIIFGHVYFYHFGTLGRMLHAWRFLEALVLFALLSCYLVWAITTQRFLTFIVHCMTSFCCLHKGTLVGMMHRTVKGRSHCPLHTTFFNLCSPPLPASQSCLRREYSTIDMLSECSTPMLVVVAFKLFPLNAGTRQALLVFNIIHASTD
jgi:hypothetical protein